MNTVVSTGTQISKDNFIKAARNGNAQVIQDYINSEADLDVHQPYGWTALHWASGKGETECVRLLIQAGANLNVQYGTGKTALHYASWSGYTKCVKLLIAAGSDLNVQTKDGQTALHLASREGKTEYVKLLVGAGADRNVQDEYGWTALHWASWKGKTECVKLLIGAGADKSIRTTSDYGRMKAGSQAIDIAKKRGKTEIVELLENTFATIIQCLVRMYLKRKDYLEILSLKPDGSGYLELKAEFESLAALAVGPRCPCAFPPPAPPARGDVDHVCAEPTAPPPSVPGSAGGHAYHVLGVAPFR